MENFKLNNELKLGVATASTQIEGGDTNNTWYKFSQEKGNVKDGSSPVVANNHYILYKQDIELMKSMGIQIYRMSIEWARIEPVQDEFNKEAINHYIDEIQLLQDAGIDVLVTLHHFSNPLWFDDLGGFLNKNCVNIFLKYVEYVTTQFKGLVKEYCTINESNIYATSCYLFGDWAPKKKSIKLTKKIMKNLAIAHIESYKLIKKIDCECRVGFANHMIMWAPKNPKNIFDKMGANFYDKYFQKSLTDAMAYGIFKTPLGHSKKYRGEYFDYFGMNYYTRNYIKGFKRVDLPNLERNDLGWEISSEALRELCERFYKCYGKEIYITENGTCDSKDNFRAKYIYDHLKAIHDLPYVKRYYHWTFIDNFEWAQGESARFGLVELNFRTQERKIRESGHFYTEIIKNQGVTDELIAKYLKR